MSHVDVEMLSELKSLMEDEFKTLLQTYLDDSRLRVSEISSAVAANDSTALRNAAHSLKGSSGNLGATNLAEICRELECMGRDNVLHDAKRVLEDMVEEYRIVAAILSGELDK